MAYNDFKRQFYLLLIPIIIFIGYKIYISNQTSNLTIYYTNEWSGRIKSKLVNSSESGKNEIGGFSILSTIVKNTKTPYILLDSGNALVGTPESEDSKGMAIIEMMNMVGYTALGLGASEFEWGKNNLFHLSTSAKFPFLSANLIDKDSNSINRYILPYTVKKINGLKIGILSITSPDTLEDNLTQNIKNLDLKPTFQTLRNYIYILREQEKVDIIILLSRYGLYNYKSVLLGYEASQAFRMDDIVIADEIPGIDIIIGGKTSVPLNEAYIAANNKTIICQTYGFGESVGKLTLIMRKKDNKILTFKNEIIPLLKNNDSDINKKIQDYENEIFAAKYNTLIGKINVNLYKELVGESKLGNFIVDVIRERSGADIALFPNKFIKTNLNAGRVTYRMIYEMLPFNDKIIKTRLTGLQIKQIFETSINKSEDDFLNVSGVKIFYKPDSKMYERISRIELSNTQEIVDDKLYTLACTERMLNPMITPNLLRDGISTKISSLKIRDIIINYIQTHVPLNIDETKRYIVIEK